MHILRIHLMIFLLCPSVNVPVFAQDLDQFVISDPESEGAIGLLTGHQLELGAWESWDVLMKSTEVSEGRALAKETGEAVQEGRLFISETVEYSRFVYDQPQRRFLFVKSTNIEEHLFDQAGDEVINPRYPRMSEQLKGFVIDEKTGVRISRVESSTAREIIPGATFERIRALYGIQDPRVAGLALMRGGYSLDKLNDLIGVLATKDRFLSATEVGKNRRRLEFRIKPERVNDSNVVVELDFNVETLTPVRMTTSTESGFGLLATRNKLEEVNVDWQPKSDLYVPEKLRGYLKFAKSVGGETYILESEIERRLHWFCLNEPLADEMFDGSMLKELEKMRKFIDPESNDANEIETSTTKKPLKSR